MGRRRDKKTDEESCTNPSPWVEGPLSVEWAASCSLPPGTSDPLMDPQKCMSWGAVLQLTTLVRLIDVFEILDGKNGQGAIITDLRRNECGDTLDLRYLCFLWTHFDVKQGVVPNDRPWLHEADGDIFMCFDMSDGNTPGSCKSPLDFPPHTLTDNILWNRTWMWHWHIGICFPWLSMN